MLNHVALVGKLKTIAGKTAILEVDENLEIGVVLWDKLIEIAEDKVGTIIGIKGHLNSNMEVIAETVSFLQVS